MNAGWRQFLLVSQKRPFLRHQNHFMGKLKFFFLVIVLSLTAGCSGSHAIQCINVDEQKICFVREVWGFNGDKASLTISDNVCHQPSKENDYVSNSLRSQEVIFYKVESGKLYVYAESMDKPKNKFPVEVVFEPYEPTKPDGNLIEEGYQELDLSHKTMTWCFSDMF